MKPRPRLAASLASALTVVLVAVAWVLFAPPQLGGQTSYVILNGNSMEPGMKRGDLAIVREAGSYEVGDVVTYRHPQIGPVIHRIIARDGARYVLQGDNNDFIDPYRPMPDEVVGELWVHIPGVGSWLARFRQPVYMAGLLFVAFIGLGGAAAKAQSKSSARPARPANRPRRAGSTTGGSPMNQLLRNWQDTVSVLAAAGIALIGLAWVAFHRPTHHDVPANIPYAQAVEYSYSAVPADGRVYDTGVARAGEPVYRRLSDRVAFKVDYRLEVEGAAGVAGSYHLVAELSDQNGWKRTIELTPETGFSGLQFSAEGVLDLAQAQTLIAILEEQSGVKNDRYSVAIRPQVQVSGLIGNTPFEDTFDKPLPMSLDKVQLKMDPSFEDKTPLAPRIDGLVSTERTEANTIKLLALALPVSLARVIAIGGLGLVLAASGWLAIEAARQRALNAKSSLLAGRTRLSSPLVNVRGTVPTPRQRVVDVASVEDLGRIAAKLGAVILQEARPGYHAFFVHDMEITYRYEAITAADSHSTEPAPYRRSA